jgi:hypothetical protein
MDVEKITAYSRFYDIMSKQINYLAQFVLDRNTDEETALKYMKVLINRKTNK